MIATRLLIVMMRHATDPTASGARLTRSGEIAHTPRASRRSCTVQHRHIGCTERWQEIKMKRGTIGLVAIAAVVVLVGVSCASTYNKLNTLDQAVSAQWAQVENVYQRRADLIPNLVATVKGAAAFEKDTLTAVTEARAKVSQITLTKDALDDPATFKRFQAAQDQLSSALSRLLAVSEAYPTLKATENFRDLQAQLEGSENRIVVERQRFNEVARDFNTARNNFPTNLMVGFFGSRFAEKQYFTAQAGSNMAPKVQF
jgi:LemA protein